MGGALARAQVDLPRCCLCGAIRNSGAKAGGPFGPCPPRAGRKISGSASEGGPGLRWFRAHVKTEVGGTDQV